MTLTQCWVLFAILGVCHCRKWFMCATFSWCTQLKVLLFYCWLWSGYTVVSRVLSSGCAWSPYILICVYGIVCVNCMAVVKWECLLACMGSGTCFNVCSTHKHAIATCTSIYFRTLAHSLRWSLPSWITVLNVCYCRNCLTCTTFSSVHTSFSHVVESGLFYCRLRCCYMVIGKVLFSFVIHHNQLVGPFQS